MMLPISPLTKTSKVGNLALGSQEAATESGLYVTWNSKNLNQQPGTEVPKSSFKNESHKQLETKKQTHPLYFSGACDI